MLTESNKVFMYDSRWKASLRRKLWKWFDENQRDLPWRKRKTPYRIWVSEIMLQQTQVATVVDYYKRFMNKFPNLKRLAAAEESEVLKLWEGLGYYRRARQMHAAAQKVVDEHGGKFPTDFDQVLALPGIGRYTAGAILSISLDQRQPILEGNTIRLFSRLMELRGDPKSSSNQKQLWEFSESILPKKRCGDFNQALMELGSEVCHPRDPKCLICPINDLCPTRIKGLQAEIPAKSVKIKYESVHETVVVVERKNRFLVRKCPSAERWAGLWDFPRFSLKETTPESIEAKLKLETGIVATVAQPYRTMKHAVTRFRITLQCYKATNIRGRLNPSRAELCWMTHEELEQAAMSVTGRKIANDLRTPAKT